MKFIIKYFCQLQFSKPNLQHKNIRVGSDKLALVSQNNAVVRTLITNECLKKKKEKKTPNASKIPSSIFPITWVEEKIFTNQI